MNVNPKELFRKGKTMLRKADSVSNYDETDEEENDSDDESKIKKKSAKDKD